MARNTSPGKPTAFAWPDGRRAAVSLTFDDARPSQIDRGMEILGSRGVRATFYVSPAGMDQRIDGWRAAVRTGHEIGNHTLTHPCSGNFGFARANALEDYNLDRMERELLDASDAIKQRLGVKPVTFGYPCGQSFVGRGREVRSYVPLVARHFLAGRGAFSEMHNDPAFCDLAQVFGMDGDDAPLDRLTFLVDRAADAGGWLILFGHEVGDAGPQTTRASVLDRLGAYLTDAANGIWVDTVAAVARHIAAGRS